MKLDQTYRIRVTFAWWWTWLYVPAVYTLVVFGWEPDLDKLQRAAKLATRVRLVLVDNRVIEA